MSIAEFSENDYRFDGLSEIEDFLCNVCPNSRRIPLLSDGVNN